MFLNKFKFLARTSANLPRNHARTFAFKSDLKIKWVRPAVAPCTSKEKSGDLKNFQPPPQTKLLVDFDKSEELKTANDVVKSMFTLEHNRRNDSVEIFKRELVDQVKRHTLDMGSPETKIAKMTAHIVAMQDIYEKFPRNRVIKVQLKELIEKRKKALRLLRVWDYKRFEWILEKMDLVYKPYPEQFDRVTRKDSLRKLTNIHCDNIKQERLDEYRQELESHQLGFLEEKIKNLEFIRSEQIACKVPVTVSTELIQEVKKQYKELKARREEVEEANRKLSAKEDYELKL